MTSRWTSSIPGVLVLCLLCFHPQVAHSQNKHKDQIQQLQLRLVEYTQRDGDKIASKELALAEIWLQESQTELAKGETKACEFVLRKVEAQLEFSGALLDHHEMVTLAKERDKAAADMQTKTNEAEIDLEQVTLKMKNLQKKLDQLTQQK